MKKRFIARAYIPALSFLFAFVSVFTFLSFKNMTGSSATSFNAGNIISDYVMSDYNSMSESEIQSFLKSKGSCNNTDYSLYQYVTNLYPKTTWHWENGHFICMADESFDGESAAHIIYRAAQDFRINPKVLIVLLEKEQSLITDSYPNSVQYRSATGYGCPDTAACDSQYYGFKNQVRNAAELYRWILDNGSKYYPVGWNYIQYNPDRSCGGSDVYIENRATSALYQYTPYQPNSGAIAAGYGTAPCGAYGNRNFFLYFSNWFGDTAIGGQPITLAEGYYNISAKSNRNQRLDVSGTGTENGVNINLWSSNDSGAQEWLIQKSNEEGYYYLINPHSKKYLSISSKTMYNGNNVYQWDFTDSCTQKWKPYLTSDGYVTFISACSASMALDISGGNTFNGNNVQIWTINNLDAQKWSVIPQYTLQTGTFRFRFASDNNKSIDVSGTATNNGANINLWENNNSGAQEWSIIRDWGSGYYYIMNPHSGKFLDTAGGLTYTENNIYQWQLTGSCSQKWGILKTIDNKYTLVSSCAADKVLDVSGGDAVNGTNIRIWTANNLNAQKWTITPIHLIDNGTYRVVSSMTNKSIDVSGVGTENGTNIHLWDNNTSGAQEWQINKIDDIHYRFKNPHSGKYFDLSGAVAYDGNNINLWEGNDFCAQKWSFMKTSDDTFAIISGCSDSFVVDAQGANTYNGTNIQVWPFIVDNKAHMWKLQAY